MIIPNVTAICLLSDTFFLGFLIFSKNVLILNTPRNTKFSVTLISFVNPNCLQSLFHFQFSLRKININNRSDIHD